MTQKPCELCDDLNRQTIGKAGDTVDVYALRGGAGIDSVFQLGVAHAHIVAPELPAPALLVGVSGGAVHATAIADILKEPAELEPADRGDPEACRAASLNRFREILYEYQDFVTDLPGTLPDAFEADAGRPLQPNPQAIHFKAERDSRQQALRARSGLIALFNDVFRQTITIRTITRIVRAALGWKAAKELPHFKQRFVRRCVEGWNFVSAIGSAPLQCGRLLASAVHAYAVGTARVLRSWIDEWYPSMLKDWLDFSLRQIEGRPREGYTAGQIIFSSKHIRITPNLASLISGIVIGLLLISAGVALAVAATGFFFFCLIPAVLAILACLAYDVGDDLRATFEEWRAASRAELMLAYYDLRQDLGNDYLIEDLLIRLFDPEYHGRIDMADVADRAMRGSAEWHPQTPGHHPRDFTKFAPMRVVPFVADLASGEMRAIPPDRPIVDALRAAVTTVPFLHPVPNDAENEYYVDGDNVASDATSPAIDVLRLELHPDVKKVRLFSVVPVTLHEKEPRKPVFRTVDVALSALELSAFRDSHVDQEIVELYNTLIPEKRREPERGEPRRERALACFGDNRHFVRSELVTIEPAKALHTTGTAVEAPTKAARQEAIAKAVAEGCRATLGARLGFPAHGCRAMLSGSGDAPGAVEVCSHCTAFTPAVASPEVAAVASPHITATASPDVPAPPPPSIAEMPATPTVNLLFSGGVFRGVFQIGVLNALSELGMKPDVIAGSSVGSIVAAMIAHVFTSTNPDTSARKQHIAQLASTFMTLDKLIITDRFADFVRRFTLRAAAAHFSPRDTDAFFRNYDVAMSEFGTIARRVIGGIEHLFYVSPFKLTLLVQAFRSQNYGEARKLIAAYAQEICDRGLVGSEVLGAEPLALLIRQHVLSETERALHAHAIPLAALGGSDLTFLLTTTNLTTRQLEILSSASSERAALVEALLASSAFPGVFRPRWSREILFHDNTTHQYIDGGVLDNLPVSALVQRMFEAAQAGKIAFRPQDGHVPHLVLTASLEPEAPKIENRREAARLARSWMRAKTRAKHLRYNQKIDRFAKVQRDLRYIFQQYASAPQRRPIGLETLDLEVLVVKPRWLCNTFAFHPMLGFQRKRQAASIAHGCAMTFSTFARILIAPQPQTKPEWLQAWTDPAKLGDLLNEDAASLTPIDRGAGMCHFRKNTPCPFAKASLTNIPESEMRAAVKDEVDAIYRACGQPETHAAGSGP